ncbi:hypothetical protein BC628DRAFT_523421 [Trametes gibbosa]|nr:hypothetical protein BC628DRAFT_523421 [Trametes gibbosa]
MRVGCVRCSLARVDRRRSHVTDFCKTTEPRIRGSTGTCQGPWAATGPSLVRTAGIRPLLKTRRQVCQKLTCCLDFWTHLSVSASRTRCSSRVCLPLVSGCSARSARGYRLPWLVLWTLGARPRGATPPDLGSQGLSCCACRPCASWGLVSGRCSPRVPLPRAI